MIRKTIIAAGVVALLAGTSLVPAQAATERKETYKLMELFAEVFEKVRSDYVEPVNEEELVEAALNGMLSSLDPHSSYLNPKNSRDMDINTKGEFGGLGIEVTMENGWVKVVSPSAPASSRATSSPTWTASRCRASASRRRWTACAARPIPTSA